MKRRDFIQTSTGLALTSAFITKRASAYSYQEEFRNKKPRVGLIGTGWYGKSDLFRLVQVAPVEIVSLCDVDKNLLADCAERLICRGVYTAALRNVSLSFASQRSTSDQLRHVRRAHRHRCAA